MQQGMCLKDINCLPPKWKTYNVPSKKVVHYSFLLKQKREFQQFINQLGSQVSNMSLCHIIDKMCPAACEKDMNIYIFEGSEYSKSLQLKILVPKQHLRKKISLLIHLTSKNNAVSRLENLCMFIKCKKGHIWETFYNFFEFLLKKSSLNLIGTQFYVSLMCKCIIANELNFLLLLGNRRISANNKQTLVEISISKLSFPSTFAQGCASNHVKPIESSKQQTGVTSDLKILLGHEGKQKPLNSMTLKRKSVDSENGIMVKTLKVSHEFCKKLSCKCHERNKWKVFKRITQCSIVNYTDLLKADDAFDESEISQICSIQSEKFPASVKVLHNDRLYVGSNEKPFSKLGVTNEVELSLNSSHRVMDVASEMNLFETENLVNEIEQSGALNATEKNTKITSNEAITHTRKGFSDNQVKYKDYLNHNKKDSQEIIKRKLKTEPSNNIHSANECKRIPVQPIGAVITPETVSISSQMPSVGFKSMSVNERVNTNKLSKGFQSISSCKLSVSPKSFQTAPRSDCNVVNQQPMGFQTAAGKCLKISEKAFLAAQKMFEEVCSQEINLLDVEAGDAAIPKNPAFKKPAYPGENYLENDFNSEFDEKFFEEIPFDDKEVEIKPKVDFMQSPLANLNSEKSQVGKVRKSLGGRRSLKPYAMKK